MVATYFLRVDEVAKSIRGLGESIKDSIVIRRSIQPINITWQNQIIFLSLS